MMQPRFSERSLRQKLFIVIALIMKLGIVFAVFR